MSDSCVADDGVAFDVEDVDCASTGALARQHSDKQAIRPAGRADNGIVRVTFFMVR
ncbi:hypothetical protein [Halomonas halmophila]|uniref:hypothetical protein n=1 Tax=Halomonas halmophila TaxID=252 RepID=UPI001FE28E1B|nr:hypothetical protein [Halomonas halmophila]